MGIVYYLFLQLQNTDLYLSVHHNSFVLYVCEVCEDACVVGGAGPRGGDAGQVPAVEGVRGAGAAGAHGSGYGARVFIYAICLIYIYVYTAL